MSPARLVTPLRASLGVALLLRLAVAIAFPNVAASDEVFQYIEQAHRLVYGAGYVPWEYQVGLRNWAIPLLLAGPMALAHVFTPSPQAGLLLIRILLCFASLPIVWCAAKWGARFYGARGAWIAGLLTALWPDLWLMAPHPLEEALAADILLPAIYLVELCRGSKNMRHVGWAAFLLGLCFSLREQLAPAIAIAGICLCGRNKTRWLLALPLAAIPVFCAGLLDFFTWGQMFRSFWLNIELNVVLGVSNHFFDASPPGYYTLNLLYDWLWSAPFFVGFAWAGGRKLPVAAAAALVTLVAHGLIAHKELRYVFPAVALLVPLAGIGLAGLCEKTSRLQKTMLAAALLSGPYMSPILYSRLLWQDSATRLYAQLAATRPCVVAIETWDRGFMPMLPLFDARTRFTADPGPAGAVAADAVTADAVTADAIIAAAGTAIPPGFTRIGCAAESWVPFRRREPDVCAWTRPVASCPGTAVTPFVLIYPPVAKAFIIRDRLTD